MQIVRFTRTTAGTIAIDDGSMVVEDVARIVRKQLLKPDDADLGLSQQDSTFLVGPFADADLHSTLQRAAFDDEIRLEDKVDFDACLARFALLERGGRSATLAAVAFARFKPPLPGASTVIGLAAEDGSLRSELPRSRLSSLLLRRGLALALRRVP